MARPKSSKFEPDGVGFSVVASRDVMTLLAELLSNQHAFFAGVSKDWRNAWGGLPKITRAITVDTSISQLRWCFDAGLTKGPAVLENIAEFCTVKILQYAFSNRYYLTDAACYKAVANGKIDMTQNQ